MRALWTTCAVALLGLLMPAQDAWSQPMVVVMLAPGDGEASLSEMQSALESQLVDLDIGLRIEQLDVFPSEMRAQITKARETLNEAGVGLIVWTDLERRDLLFLLFLTDEGERMLIRSTRETGTTRDETFAIMVRSTVAALLRGVRVGLTVEEAEAQVPHSPGHLRAVAERGLVASAVRGALAEEVGTGPGTEGFVQVAYVPSGIATSHALHGLGIRLGVRPWRAWSFHLGYVWNAALDAEQEQPSVRLKVSRHALELGAHYHFPLGVALELSAGLSMRVTLSEVSAQSEELEGVESLDVEASTLAELGLHWQILDGLRLDLAGAVEGAFNPKNYVVEQRGARRSIMTLWSVRPAGWLGATVVF